MAEWCDYLPVVWIVLDRESLIRFITTIAQTMEPGQPLLIFLELPELSDSSRSSQWSECLRLRLHFTSDVDLHSLTDETHCYYLDVVYLVHHF